MKYIFVINNPITELITEKVINSDNNKFNKKNTVLFSYRDYKSKLGFKIVRIPILKKKIFFFSTWLDIYKVNKTINSINDEYTVFLPTTGFETFQFLINHKNCNFYCYLEEGLASYYSVSEKNKTHSNFINRHSNFFLNKIKRVYHLLNFGTIIVPYSDFFDVSNSKYEASYCFSNHCFGEHPNKIVLNISFNKNETLSNFETILVLESFVETGVLKKQLYLSLLEWLFNYLARKEKNIIYYKFHPDQIKSGVSKRIILNLFDKFKKNEGINFVEINQSIKLEDIAFNSMASEFYMVSSSVAIYANICGRKSYSLYNQVINLQPGENFKNYTNTIPSEYFNIVNLIDEN
ncbi:hypothetical protein [Thalassobellus sediminis]|uniref:hypothetical protein n=1 Tax=Thalassobellus sediminis TaxID=3367753 RepID=UPI0037BB8A3C